MIEVCLCVYKRVHKLNALITDLLNQNRQDFRINIWNNSAASIQLPQLSPERLTIINSEINRGSQARFWLVPKTTGNPIIFIDDDETLDTDFIDYNHKQYVKFGSHCILGWFTRRFNRGTYWNSIADTSYGKEVDYVGTGGMILDRSIFDEDKSLQNIPPEFCKVEDLYLCWRARMKHNMRLVSIDKKCHIVADEEDQFNKLGEYKVKAFSMLRAAGWRLKSDKIWTPAVHAIIRNIRKMTA